jgi:hypothetical protein
MRQKHAWRTYVIRVWVPRHAHAFAHGARRATHGRAPLGYHSEKNDFLGTFGHPIGAALCAAPDGAPLQRVRSPRLCRAYPSAAHCPAPSTQQARTSEAWHRKHSMCAQTKRPSIPHGGADPSRGSSRKILTGQLLQILLPLTGSELLVHHGILDPRVPQLLAHLRVGFVDACNVEHTDAQRGWMNINRRAGHTTIAIGDTPTVAVLWPFASARCCAAFQLAAGGEVKGLSPRSGRGKRRAIFWMTSVHSRGEPSNL